MEKGLIDLHRAFHADSSYSYMFSGLASYIDHAITNETMYRQVTGMAGYHINSDEDDRYNYQKSSDLSMFRCSDHDPVLVGLKLDSTLVYDPSPSINSVEILEHNLHTMTIRNAYITESPSLLRHLHDAWKQGGDASHHQQFPRSAIAADIRYVRVLYLL